MDPIQGSDQPLGAYWRRIHQYFHANKTFHSDRTQGSLLNRWGVIQHDVNFFCGCLSKIEAINQSGWSVDDKISSACAMFKGEDIKNKNFAYMHCWKILKDMPKWITWKKHRAATKTSNKKQKTVSNSSPASTRTAEKTENALGRPEGRKKEKQKVQQRSTIEAVDYLVDKMKEAEGEKDLKKAERLDMAFYLQEEKMKLDREKFEFQRELEEERILSLDLSAMTDQQKQFYEGC
uniref:No apical meristem-associated C-terminal domain-containing protein n=1 Tax=Oryza brachyantha TaxID=4533 RepID=J3MVX4_ORYBR